MFKVGDRVWWTKYKILCEVADIKYSENGTPFEWIIDTPGFKGIRFDLFRIKEITQTADSMFEELGYEKEEDLKNDRIIYRWRDSLETIFSLKEKEMWLERIGDMSGEYILEIKEHLAIHQKLIELGWVE